MVNLFLNMNMHENQNILVFVHIPKTAGTAINTALLERFKISKEEALKYYPNARIFPNREKFSVNYLFVGHWKYDTGVWPKTIIDHYKSDYNPTVPRGARWIEDSNSKIISQYSKKNIKRENLNFVPFTIIRNPYERLISAYKYLYFFEKKEDEWFFRIRERFFKDKKINSEEYNFLKFIEILNNSKQYIEDFNIVHLKTMKSFITYQDKILVNEIIKYKNLDSELNILLKKYGYEPIELKKMNVSHKTVCNYMTILKNNPDSKDIIYNFYKEDFEFFNFEK